MAYFFTPINNIGPSIDLQKRAIVVDQRGEAEKTRQGKPSLTRRINSGSAEKSAEKLVDLGALMGLIELHQFTGKTLLLGLTNGNQLTVKRQEIFQTATQIFFVATFDHGRFDSHATLQVKLANRSPVLFRQRVAQGRTGRLQILDG
jgi:stalled ribosome alternative rescue factor ArfA